MGTATAARCPYSAYAGEQGATTLFFPQEVAQMMFRLAGKAAANRCMEEHSFSRLSAVLAGRAQKTGVTWCLYETAVSHSFSFSTPLSLSLFQP